MKRICTAAALLSAGVILAGCSGRKQPDSDLDTVKVPTVVEGNNGVKLEERKVDVPAGVDDVRTAVTALLNETSHPLPEGTSLIDLKVEDGTAHLNLSKEFSKLEEMGNEGESTAQKALKRTLSQFKQIDKMLVRVEGKPFASEHTDWSAPIPVRDDEDVARRDRPSISVSGGNE